MMRPLFAALFIFMAITIAGSSDMRAEDAPLQGSPRTSSNSDLNKNKSINFKNLLKQTPKDQKKRTENYNPSNGKSENKLPSVVKPALQAVRPANSDDINRQLQNIIKLNENLKMSQSSKAAEIQAIQEQARIHQQLLKNLESTKSSEAVVSRNDVDEVLRQEKIRLIREQTSRSQEIIKSLGQQRRS